jgi:hypothetical protein
MLLIIMAVKVARSESWLLLCCCTGITQVVDAINALSKGKKDNTANADDGAVIIDSGQIRKGTHVPDLTA